jgi:hypothetical protein
MKRLSLLLSLFATSAYAVPTPVNTLGEWSSSSALSLQGIINTRGNTLVNIQSDADQLDNGLDSHWTSTGANSANLIIEVAGYAPKNAFGIYNAANPTQRQVIFAGSAAAGASTGFVPLYETFGFYLSNLSAGFTWYSDSSLNSGGAKDHMVAYQGKGEQLGSVAWNSNTYLLGWEDLNLGDWDYNDMVVTISNVRPSSVPDSASTSLLLGLGMVALVATRRSLQRRKN